MKYYIIENEAPVGPFDVNELVARGLRPTDLRMGRGYGRLGYCRVGGRGTYGSLWT